MILRLSQKLDAKIKSTLSDEALDANPHADWSCHLFTANRTQFIIISNTTSLYSCVMYGKGINDDSRFVERALSTIRKCMEDDGQAFAYQRFTAPASGTITFAKALNRSVTGSMNDLIKFAKHWLVEDGISPHELGLKLNGILLSALATERAQGYGKPSEAFRAMLESRPAIEQEES